MKHELIENIINCVDDEQVAQQADHVCHEIVSYQTEKLKMKKPHLPEPWNGHIETADIMFISSNPSIGENENYPTEDWDKKDILKYFENRFDKFERFDYKNGKYWYYINKWTGWILRAEGDNLLKDHAVLTEIVHCKSKHEGDGVAKCQKKCAERWLKEILSLFNGDYIVLVGDVAKLFYKDIKEYANGKIIIQTSAPTSGKEKDEVRKQSFYKQINGSKN